MKYEIRAVLERTRGCYILHKQLREHMRGTAERMAERNEMGNEKVGSLVEETLSIVLGAGFFPEARIVYARPSEENKYGQALKVQRVLLMPNMQAKEPAYIEKVVDEEWMDMPKDHIIVKKMGGGV